MRCCAFTGMVILAACLAGLPEVASGWTDLGVFAGPNATVAWQAAGVKPALPTPSLYYGQTGLRFDAALTPQADRVYRDAAIRLDLSSYTEFSLAIRLSEPAAVSRCSLYFKSGSGWYGGWFNVTGTHWQTITLSRGSFSPEGTPEGWHRIDAVRIALWKAKPLTTRLELAALRGRSSPLLILRNSAAIESTPAEATLINRTAERLAQWFDASGLHAAVLDDRELATTGIPPGGRLMILPYNPVIPPATLKMLTAFTDAGGKLMVMYALPPELLPLLGLRDKQWMAANPADAFSAIRLRGESSGGLPGTVRQDSWNVNIPVVDTARTIGTWLNAKGEDSRLPAVTIHSKGVYIGHVLTNVDRENKLQMVLALSSALVPEMIPFFNQQLSRRAERLFEFENWEQTRDFILRTAERHGQSTRTLRSLRQIERLREADPAADGQSMAFEAVVSRVGALRDQLREAYVSSVRPLSRQPEWRGVWCHNAGGPPGIGWPEAVRRLKQAGMNALFANHQWAGVAYYPSTVLPVSYRVAAEGDLLQQCLDACQREGIAMHLWTVLWVLENAPEPWVSEMEKAGRLMRDRDGKTIKWLCPVNPLNTKLAVDAATETVKHYAVDGFHLDYVRYPDQDACYCATCAARFRSDTGRAATRWPADVVSGADHAVFLAWRRDQMTAIVRRISQAVKTVRPGIQVSAAVWGNWPGVRDSIGQDWVKWGRDGIVDFVCPMNYVTSTAEALSLFRIQCDALPPPYPIYPGISPTTYNLPPEEVVRQIDGLRGAGARGFVLFELDADLLNTHLPALRAGATAD